MSISSTGLCGSATIVKSDLFNDVEDLKEQVNRITAIEQDIITDISNNRITAIEDDITDISNKRTTSIEDDITDISNNRIKAIEQDITDISNNRITAIEQDITDISKNRITSIRQEYCRLRRYHHEHGHLLFVVV